MGNKAYSLLQQRFWLRPSIGSLCPIHSSPSSFSISSRGLFLCLWHGEHDKEAQTSIQQGRVLQAPYSTSNLWSTRSQVHSHPRRCSSGRPSGWHRVRSTNTPWAESGCPLRATQPTQLREHKLSKRYLSTSFASPSPQHPNKPHQIKAIASLFLAASFWYAESWACSPQADSGTEQESRFQIPRQKDTLWY
jgi:hypothetical protein